MYDPMTVAFEIENPFLPKYQVIPGYWKRPVLITVWHVDPETDGTDDSCGYISPKLDESDLRIIDEMLNGEFNYRDAVAGDSYFEKRSYLHNILREYKRGVRPWWRHPKWHVWHWRLQIHPLQNFKRWAFSRCCVCGGRFGWGESPVSNQWHGGGPRWFRSEENVLHISCDKKGG